MTRTAGRIGRVALVALAATLAGLFAMAHFADRLIFIPPPSSYGPGLPGLVHLPTARGDTVTGLFADAPGATFAVLFTHGNAEDIGHLADFVQAYRALGVSVLAVDYPGYGLSTGKPSEPGAYAAADAALAWLGERGFPAGKVVLHGRSLGGAVSVDVASRATVAALVVESTFTSAFRVMLPWSGIPGDRFASLGKLPRVRCPTLVIHGTRDEVVSFGHGRQIFAALSPEHRSAWWVEGAGHNDLLWVAGDRYWRELAAFLERAVGLGERPVTPADAEPNATPGTEPTPPSGG
jgi:hypothetical protein